MIDLGAMGARRGLLVAAVLAGLSACDEPPAAAYAAPNRAPPAAAYAVTDRPVLRKVFGTDAGMHGVWSPEAFRDVDEKNWEDHFVRNPSIEAHIARGEFVPIYVHADGGPVIETRVGSASQPAVLTEQEKHWLKAKSDPYLFVSAGVANVSGIEHIGGKPTASVAGIRVPPGRWQVVVHLLEWPEGVFDRGSLYPPDFIATINPEGTRAPRYRTTVETFPEGSW